MTRFDEIVRSGDGPVRHHTFYMDDGNVVLNVSKPRPTGDGTYHSTLGTGRAFQDTQVLPHKILIRLRRPFSDEVTFVATGGLK